MFRVLQVVTYMGRGGLETMLMNYYRHMDRSRIQFDFLVHRDFQADYDGEIESLGGRIYRVPRLNPLSPGYYRALNRFFSSHPYPVVHSHLDCMSAYPLRAAKRAGAPVRIAHAHNTNQDKNWKYVWKRLSNRRIGAYATDFFACGEAAGAWMFPGKTVQVLRNAVRAADYVLQEKVRQQVRQEWGAENRLVLGHVGRFQPQKNHEFLIVIFAAVAERIPDALLVLVGAGTGLEAIREKVRRLGLAGRVIFTGVRSDVNRLMQAMDVFVFPSLYEGLPVTMIEAQAAGLPCVISDRVPTECIVTEGLVSVKRLSDTPQEWAKCILSSAAIPRTDRTAEIRASGFDVAEAAKWLEGFYIEAYTRACADHLHPDL